MIAAALAIALVFGLAAASDDPLSAAEKLYGDARWADVVALWHGLEDPPAALDYYAGMSLARLGNRDQARRVLEAGQVKSPRDKRFPLELAGLAFEQKDFSQATKHIKRALRLDPSDRYANDFLASIYFVEENLEAAVRYWNRIGKPRIEQVRMEPEPAVAPVLLDRAFAIAPASTLELRDLRATQASLDLLGIFPSSQFALQPRDQTEQFDLVFRSTVRNGWGSTKTEGLISLFRGAPYETIYPEFYNLGHAAVNITSLVRFDSNKQRAAVWLGAPVGGNPNRRFEFFLDGRRENWDLRRTFYSAGAAPGSLRLNKIEGGATIRAPVNDRWSWSSGVSLSGRTVAHVQAADRAFTNGLLLKYRGQVDHPLLRVPEKRLIVNSSAEGEFGRLFAHGYGAFERITGAVAAHWLPQAQGDKYELAASARSGRTFGEVPLDELFILGLERDNDLPLGAHIGTRDGKKGNAPLGRTYFLANWDADRTVYQTTFLKIKLGPFLDSGKIADPSGAFGSHKWLWDTGARLKLRVLSRFSIAINYGKDLRGGHNAFYLTALP